VGDQLPLDVLVVEDAQLSAGKSTGLAVEEVNERHHPRVVFVAVAMHVEVIAVTAGRHLDLDTAEWELGQLQPAKGRGEHLLQLLGEQWLEVF